VPVWEAREHKWSAGVSGASRLLRAQAQLMRRSPERCDVVIVGYPGHLDLLAARRTARGAPVVFNPLVSLWDTLVLDRGRFAAGSLAARTLRLIDRMALRAADLVVADTQAQADFFARLGDLPADRVEVCFVGAEDRLFTPGWKPDGPVLFVGKLIPLHGLETILAAAELTPELSIRIIGSGQLAHLLSSTPKNVEWTPWTAYASLPAMYRRAACALGIFGTSGKAQRVIPNKAYQALACATPLVTADTPAARELLVDRESALLVPPGQPEQLAAALRQLASAPALAQRLSEGGSAAYRARASEEVLGERWRTLLERLIDRRRH
jgi:glycosyltransferase involved in cell wall biosynthesis